MLFIIFSNESSKVDGDDGDSRTDSMSEFNHTSSVYVGVNIDLIVVADFVTAAVGQ
jgi:hypothetical protein